MYHTCIYLLIQWCLIKEHAKIAQSRAAIEEAGIDVLLRNPDAGMSEIALAAGVGRATLYRHFDSRKSLIQALAIKCLEDTDVLTTPLKALGLEGKRAIDATIDVLMPMASRYRFLMSLWNIASDDRKTNQIYQRQLDEFSQFVQQAQEAGEFSSELSVTWIVWSFDALLNSAWHLVELGEMTPADAAVAFKKSFFSGCQ